MTQRISALVTYDHLNTLAREIELIWSRDFSSVTLVYYLNRSMLLLWAALTAANQFSPYATLSVSNISIYPAFSSVRIYAISRRDWPYVVIVCLLNMVPVATNAVRILLLTPLSGVSILQHLLQLLGKVHCVSVSMATCSCVIAADLVIQAVMWQKTYVLRRQGTQARIKSLLTMCFLRDGASCCCLPSPPSE
ncbi:hypothetical protein OBBRIDRAFT_732760 [Obba rivulosa]|uniref:DUF6533 domain-containing protein n=1 Tax=Obba rivulosa TaxID=1052685 RepID=A0A8E2AWI2_9APHY|nr:hypothetical protein OBBRIDRAFT_732760 [Obba rivulosa]